jgi:hypothetical protein
MGRSHRRFGTALSFCLGVGCAKDDETSAGSTTEGSGVDDATSGTGATTGGESISLEECAALTTPEVCEAATVVGAVMGHCVWVEIHSVTAGCEQPTQTTEQCLGVSGPEPGCNSYECDSGETHWLFYRMVTGGYEVFENPLCGPQPEGWTPCHVATAPDECACGCP